MGQKSVQLQRKKELVTAVDRKESRKKPNRIERRQAQIETVRGQATIRLGFLVASCSSKKVNEQLSKQKSVIMGHGGRGWRKGGKNQRWWTI